MSEGNQKDKSPIEAVAAIRDMVLPKEVWGAAMFSNDEVVLAVYDLIQEGKKLLAVTAERDALLADRDALAAKLAALEKRIAEAPKRLAYYGADYCVAVLKLTNEEASVFMEDWK